MEEGFDVVVWGCCKPGEGTAKGQYMYRVCGYVREGVGHKKWHEMG